MYKPRLEMIERDVYMMFFIYSSYNAYLLFAIGNLTRVVQDAEPQITMAYLSLDPMSEV